MPSRLKRPCRHPMCPELVDDKSGYCDKHRGLAAKRYDEQRGNFRERGYTSAWDKLRKWYLQRNPLCVDCLEQGRVTPGKLVHHIIPKADGGSDAEDNLMALCHSCHNIRHDRFGGKRGNG